MNPYDCLHVHLQTVQGKLFAQCRSCARGILECDTCAARTHTRPEIEDSGWTRYRTDAGGDYVWYACPQCSDLLDEIGEGVDYRDPTRTGQTSKNQKRDFGLRPKIVGNGRFVVALDRAAEDYADMKSERLNHQDQASLWKQELKVRTDLLDKIAVSVRANDAEAALQYANAYKALADVE